MRLKKLLKAKADRERESLRIWRPNPTQEAVLRGMLSGGTHYYLIIGGNRSGKSTVGLMILASMVTRIPITLSDGTQVRPWDQWAEDPLTIWIIGKGEKHIGQVIYPGLFEKGFFRIIPEGRTWVTYDHTNPNHVARKSESQPAEPLIPSRFFDNKCFAWVDKKANHFGSCRLKITQSEIFTFTSNADPQQGVPVHAIFIDEDIDYPAYIEEWKRRLLDYMGFLFWMAMPHYDNLAIDKLCQIADEQKHSAERFVRRFELPTSQNKYINDEYLAKVNETSDEDTIAQRDYGQIGANGIRMFPDFSRNFHVLPRRDGSLTKLETFLAARNGRPPSDWAHWFAIDPGWAKCGVMLAACPPPEFGEHIVVYDNVFARSKSPAEVAAIVKSKMCGTPLRIYIDWRRSRQAESDGVTIKAKWEAAFRAAGIQSLLSGWYFTDASDRKGADIIAIHEAFVVRDSGLPRVVFWRETTLESITQIGNYLKERPDSDKPDPRQVDEMPDCLRYLVGAGVHFVVPPVKPQTENLLPQAAALLKQGNKVSMGR